MSAIRGRVCVRATRHALVLASMLLGLVSVNAQAATVPADFYGVNSDATLANDPVARGAAFKTMRAGGLSVVRVDAYWNSIEPAPPVAGVHAYNWATYDSLVADLARNGLRWYPMLVYSAPWASSVAGDSFAPPAGDANYAAYAAALVQRYGASGSFWAEHPELPKLPTTVYGIWNEPSNQQYWHGPEATPARYMRLYLAARAAIKAVDPGARVAAGGLLDSGVVNANEYLRAMLDSAPTTRNQIDALGWHPYVGNLDQVLSSIKRARTTLNQYGLRNVPIEVSEVGWHSGFSRAERVQWMRRLAARLPHARMNVTRLMPYIWNGDPQWQITNLNGSLGQTGHAYFAGIRDASTRTAKVRPGLNVGRRGTRVRFSGAIVPAVPGARAWLQRKSSAGFVTLRRSGVRPLGNSRSRYRMTIKPRRRTSVYRVLVRPPASSGHARGTSREKRIRTLRGR